MSLNARQRLAYRHRCSIFRPTFTVDANTKLQTATGYAQIGTDVPCLFKMRDDVAAPSVMGAIAGDNMWTHDEVHFAIDQEIDEDYWLKDTTTDALGSASPNSGRYFVVSGQPRSVPSLGGRKANMRVVQAVQSQQPPTGVS